MDLLLTVQRSHQWGNRLALAGFFSSTIHKKTILKFKENYNTKLTKRFSVQGITFYKAMVSKPDQESPKSLFASRALGQLHGCTSREQGPYTWFNGLLLQSQNP